MWNFTSGTSAIRASQAALDTIANNIANANNPDYHRQVPRLASRPDLERLNHLMGTGVEVSRIARLRDDTIAQGIRKNISNTQSISTQAQIARQIESFLTPGIGSIHDRSQAFLNEVERLSAAPDGIALRQSVITKAGDLASSFNSLNQDLQKLADEVDAELAQVLKTVNELAPKVVELNLEIAKAQHRGLDPNAMLDQRDAIINQIAEHVDVSPQEFGEGLPVLIMGDNALAGSSYDPLRIELDSDGKLLLRQGDSPRPTTISNGKLEGLITSRNEIISDYQNRIDELARSVISTFNRVHATGVGLDGPFADLKSQNSVTDVNASLAQAGLPFEVEAGELYISVTDQSNGEQTLHRLNVDPSAQSLNDVATLIGTVNHLQAVVNPNTGGIAVLAEPGYAFDFTGSLQTKPDSTLITGTALPQASGRYTGTANETYQFVAQNTGTTGVTPNLAIEVRDSQGQLVTTLDVGLGYESGQPLDIGNGVSVSLNAGTLNAADQFSVELIANPDSSGILTALGLNAFFVGDGSANMGVSELLSSDHRNLATSRSGLPGDAANLHALARLRDAAAFGSNNVTLTEEIGVLTASIGSTVQDLSATKENLTAVRQALDAERDSLSGVDPNEELVHMLEFQRAFQMASRYISTLNQTLDELMNIVR